MSGKRKPKLMPIPEAIIEGKRWLAYLDAQEFRSKQLGEIAAKRREGMSLEDARREVAKIDRQMGLTVYDGALLADAVRAFIANSEQSS